MPAKPAATCVSKTLRHLGAQHAAQQRDVLAPGVHDDLHRRVGQHARPARRRRSPRRAGRARDAPAARRRRVGDGELDQAQQRAVAALAHELGVERQPPGRRAPISRRAPAAQSVAPPLAAHGLAPGSSHSTLSWGRPALRETSVPCARIHCAGAEQAGFLAEAGSWVRAGGVEEGVADFAGGDHAARACRRS